ncbi:hypothetical protein GF342_05170 [Candidatus Woesearchaeota archaeon]|nr:hypothetical protein [Candidatus Woesearchaeota archaeon]
MTTPSLEGFLAELSLAAAGKAGKKVLEKIKRVWDTGKFGFSPYDKELATLAQVSKDPAYKRFREIVGKNYPYLVYIKIGFLLHKLTITGEYDRAENIRKQMYQRRGQNVSRIVHIASTGVLAHVLDYLADRKEKHCLSPTALRQEFDAILKEWNEIAIPVKTTDTIEFIFRSAVAIAKKNPPRFFIYSLGKQTEKAWAAVARIRKDPQIIGSFVAWSKNNNIHGKDHFICVFYNVENELGHPLTRN